MLSWMTHPIYSSDNKMASLLSVSQADLFYRSGFWLKPVQVLHGVSLEVPKKSVFGFLGANGAGKTTLIQLIVGIRKPSAGRVLINGKDASSREARAMIGFLPERPYFYDHLTGEQFLRFFGALAGMPAGRCEERIPHVLSAVGMSDARKVVLKKYSKGMLQRIGIAQAILHDPEFLVLDEPMSGLDPLGRKEIRELIQSLARAGKTIFFSSHVIPDVETICDQVALIKNGRILGCGPIDSLGPAKALSTEIRYSLNGTHGSLVSEPAEADRIIRELLEKKAHIEAVTPIRPSLESLFR